MSSRRSGAASLHGGFLLTGALLSLLAWNSARGAAFSIERIPATALPNRAANWSSEKAAVTPDGRYVAFNSNASNLVPGDMPGAGANTFVRDMTTGLTELVSVSTEGEPASASFYAPAISTDGRFVVFVSNDANLVPGDTNQTGDVFLRDRVAGTTERVSLASDGTEGTRNSSGRLSVSTDGRYVAFVSNAALVADDTNGRADVYVRDRTGGTTERVSIATGGSEASSESSGPRMTADGRFVVFDSRAADLTAGDTNLYQDVFIHDRVSATTERCSLAWNGAEAAWDCFEPDVSDDGRYVVFSSFASNLTQPGSGRLQVYVRDRVAGTTECVSLSTVGAPALGESRLPAISSDGRHVAFRSTAPNLVAGDTNGLPDFFARDRLTGKTERVSVSSSGAQADVQSEEDVAISGGGRYVAFTTRARHLDPNVLDGADNDVFVRDRALAITILASIAMETTEPVGYSTGLALDAAGQLVAFNSTAPNLVPDDSSEAIDTFIYDRQGSVTARASVTTGGGELRGSSDFEAPSLSADGRYVAFISSAPGPSNTLRSFQVFVRDRQSGTTEQISVGIGGAAPDADSYGPTISADGRYVVFCSAASNLVPNDDWDRDAFLFDRSTRTLERISVSPTGQGGNRSTYSAAISADGRWIAFASEATNLVPDVGLASSNVFVRDRVNGVTELVSVSDAEALADGASWGPSLSADGRYVAFSSSATNLTADPREYSGYFVRDRVSGTTTKLSVAFDGLPHSFADPITGVMVSASGRYAVFCTESNGLVPGDTNFTTDVFVRDLPAGVTARVSVPATGGEANHRSFAPTISADGRAIGFVSTASNLVPGDGNRYDDVFVTSNPLWDSAPAGTGESYSVVDGAILNVPAPGVLANDHDPEGAPLTAVLGTAPQHGFLSLQSNGGFTYTPTRGYTGPDGFTYRAADSFNNSAPIAVSLMVLPAPPTISDVTNRTTAEDTATGVISFTVGDLETPASSLVVSGTSSNTALVPNAGLSFGGSGASRTVTITPAANQFGSTTITLTVSDGVATTSDTFVLTVTPVNDPPAAQNDSYSIAEDGTLTVTAPGVLANDTDLEGNALTAARVSGPAHGVLTLAISGSFTYQPDADYRGPDSFTCRTSDGQADSATTTVNLIVTSVNDPPRSAAQSVATQEDTPRAITLTGEDPEGDSLTYTILSPPAHGSLSGSGVSRTYTPSLNYHGTDSFIYRVSDGSLTSDPATVTITVEPVNDPPAAGADAYTINKNLRLQVAAPGALGNDADVEGDPLTAELVESPAHGTLSLSPTGAFVYTPAAGYEGADQFKYRATDGDAGSAAVIVNLTVTGNNNPPVGSDTTIELDEDTGKSFELPAADPDGGSLAYFILTQPAHGRLSGSGASRTYQPNANYSGPDTFIFQATDGQAVSGRATVTFNVRPVNDPPVANAGTDRTVSATGPTTSVGLNGSASADVEPEPLAYAWSLAGTVIATTATPTVNLAPGIHSLLLTVTDVGGASASDVVVLTVQDSTAPQLMCPADLSVPANVAAGATVVYTVTATDAVSAATVTCTPPSGTVFPAGASTVTCTATDAAGNQATCTFRVTVTAPASTAGKVSASGAIPVTGGSGKLKVTATYKAGGAVKGSVSFTDPATRKTIKSSSLTALVISGTRARIFGTTRLPSGTTGRFLAEAEDLGTATGADRFRLELSDGRVFGAANLTKGSISITR